MAKRRIAVGGTLDSGQLAQDWGPPPVAALTALLGRRYANSRFNGAGCSWACQHVGGRSEYAAPFKVSAFGLPSFDWRMPPSWLDSYATIPRESGSKWKEK